MVQVRDRAQARATPLRSRLLPLPESEAERPSGWTAARWCLRVALPAWLASRVVILAALLVSQALQGGTLQRAPSFEPHRGLFAWDSGWYHDIATVGYGALPHSALRFFPLLPILGRLLAYLGIGTSAGVLIVANVAALLYGAALTWLVRVELGSERLAKRTAWLVALSPGAVVYSLAYPEPITGAAAVAFFLALKRDRMWWAAAAGAVAGLSRPVGILLALVGVVDLLVKGRWSTWTRSLIPIAGPIVGTGAYLVYAWVRFGDPLLPYSVTKAVALHGPGLSNPLTALTTIHYGGRFSVEFDVTLVLIVLALFVLSAFLLPVGYTLWSAAMIFLSVTSTTENSLPRYLFAPFPVLIAAVVLPRTERQWAATLALSTAVFAVVAGLGFSPLYTL
jgi:hypothetical protein